MIQIGLGIIIGFLIGLYAGSKEFRNKTNEFFKGITGSLSKLEFKKNNNKDSKKPERRDYENYYNPKLYCVIPGYRTRFCHLRYCKHCPVYLKYKEGEEKENQPIGLNEDYW